MGSIDKSTVTFGYFLLKRSRAWVMAVFSASPPKPASLRVAVSLDWTKLKRVVAAVAAKAAVDASRPRRVIFIMVPPFALRGRSSSKRFVSLQGPLTRQLLRPPPQLFAFAKRFVYLHGGFWVARGVRCRPSR